MPETTVVVVGAGQAGLAMSWHLQAKGIDHVVLDRGRVANAWRTERWDSLRLLTPNWMTRLPGHSYCGPDPDGYLPGAGVTDLLVDYAQRIDAPVREQTPVRWADSDPGRVGPGSHWVVTDDGTWRCRAIVIATGACGTPRIPTLSANLPGNVVEVSPLTYRNPAALAGIDGGQGRVLVVGASASGAQIADELARAGRRVVVAAGGHTRLPRRYRGVDIHRWMLRIGALDERWDEVDDVHRLRRLPSLQLIGSPESRDLGLNELQDVGVQVVGKLAAIDTGATPRALFAGSLPNTCAAADLKLNRLLDRIDAYVERHGRDREVGEPSRPKRTEVGRPETSLDLADVSSVVWATGFRPNFPWLPDRLLDEKGALRHDGGVLSEPGWFALGQPFLRTLRSTFIGGVGQDAAAVTGVLIGHLARESSHEVSLRRLRAH